MSQNLLALAILGLAVVLGHAGQSRSSSVKTDPGRQADLAAIEKGRQQDIAVTIARDPVGLTDLWTDDAIRLGAGVAEIGKAAIRASNERQVSQMKIKVLSYVPEVKDFTFLDGGWAVEWRTFTASFVELSGGEPKEVRGSVLGVWKRLPDGTWKAFRGMGTTDGPK